MELTPFKESRGQMLWISRNGFQVFNQGKQWELWIFYLDPPKAEDNFLL